MANILIVDDDKMICDMLCQLFEGMGCHVTYALTLKEGIDRASDNNFDVVFLDVYLPDGDGLSALSRFRDGPALPEVVIFTGEGNPDGAELAIKNGAWDYVQKPLESREIVFCLNRVLKYRKNLKRAEKPAVALKLDGIIGSSTRMRACFDSMAQAATSEASVLITGETGTGKELFAQAIHNNSNRADKPFVVVDCAALPETLVESSLLGHEKGAFTGAETSREGMIKQADGGTLFLDEVGELSFSLQKVFLRVLQEHRFRPIGGRYEIESDFRLLAATNQNLDRMADRGNFRKDLLYRLRSITIDLPPLRERHNDLKELAWYYTARISERYGVEIKGFSSDFLDVLFAYEWPGNVRELVKTLEGAISEARYEPTLFPKHLPIHIRVQLARASVNKSFNTGDKVPQTQNKSISNMPLKFQEVREATISEMERDYFQDLIKLTKGSIKKCCEVSGLSRNRLYFYLKKHNISRLGWR
jgi:two-component system NtrC family response regulator